MNARDRIWQTKVEKAKELISARKHSQMEVAKLAMSVCTISWGGASREIRKRYTLSKFANDSGMDVRTLSNWVAVRHCVYNKLPKEVADSTNFTKLSHIASRVKRESTPAEVMEAFQDIVRKNSVDARITRYLCDLRTVAYNFDQMNAAEKCSKDVLEEVLYQITIIREGILRYQPNLRPRYHGIASNAAPDNRRSAAEAIVGPKNRRQKNVYFKANGKIIRVTPKDRDVMFFLKNKEGKWVGPTEIGVTVHGHNSNSASAWAYRSLKKFEGTGVVERNSKGNYRWIGE